MNVEELRADCYRLRDLCILYASRIHLHEAERDGLVVALKRAQAERAEAEAKLHAAEQQQETE